MADTEYHQKTGWNTTPSYWTIPSIPQTPSIIPPSSQPEIPNQIQRIERFLWEFRQAFNMIQEYLSDSASNELRSNFFKKMNKNGLGEILDRITNEDDRTVATNTLRTRFSSDLPLLTHLFELVKDLDDPELAQTKAILILLKIGKKSQR